MPMLNVLQEVNTEIVPRIEAWIGQGIDPSVTYLDLRRFKVVSPQPFIDTTLGVVPNVVHPNPSLESEPSTFGNILIELATPDWVLLSYDVPAFFELVFPLLEVDGA